MKVITVTLAVTVSGVNEEDVLALKELIKDHILQDFDEAEVELKELSRSSEDED